MAYVIQRFVENAGLNVTPDDLSKYPDYPRKSDEITEEEHQVGCAEWWNFKHYTYYFLGSESKRAIFSSLNLLNGTSRGRP